jgi:hypothetical protein
MIIRFSIKLGVASFVIGYSAAIPHYETKSTGYHISIFRFVRL